MTPTTRTTESAPVQPVPVLPPVGPAEDPRAPGPEVVVEPAEGGAWIRRGPHESPRDYDARWRDEVYQGDVPQFTVRAVLTGTALGSLLAISNLYIGLKAGWTLSITITAMVISTALWRGLAETGMARTRMSVLEQNCMQSAAAAAGNTSASMMITAVPAYMLVTGTGFDPLVLIAWTFFVSMLGLSMAVPLKRRLLHYEALAWPSALAAAQTLRTLHERGRNAVSQTRWLFGTALIAGAIRWSIGNTFTWWKLPAWPETIALPGRLGALGLGVDASALYYAAGALLGPRVTVWMTTGSALVWLVFAPWLVSSGRLDEPGYGSVMLAGALWAGSGLMIASGITAFLVQAGVVLRGLHGLKRTGASVDDPIRSIEIPRSWGTWGFLVSSVVIIGLGQMSLGIPWWLGALGIVLSTLLAVIAVRATGETDITPAGALGKITQLGFGVVAPQSIATNLMGTSIVATSGATASDVAINLKCGHLLGADPRQQWRAQVFGVLAGACVVVGAFSVMVPDVSVLGTEALPAPAAQAWRAVAEIVPDGLGVLDGVARAALVGGVIAGMLLTLGEALLPRRPEWWPSSFGLGIGMVIGFSESAAFLVGALVAAFFRRRLGERGEADDRIVAVASGGIAGDSLVGVLLALLIALGWMAA